MAGQHTEGHTRGNAAHIMVAEKQRVKEKTGK